MREESIKAIRCGKLIDGTGAKPKRDDPVPGRGGAFFDVGRGIDIPDEAELVKANRCLQPNSLGLP